MRVQLWQAGVAIALAGASANAQSITITHSLDPFVDPGAVACQVPTPQRTAENSYYRTFDLSDPLFSSVVTGPFHITSVEVGVETATHPTGQQDITVNLWVDCNGGEPLVADLTLIGTATVPIFDTVRTVETIPIDAVICNDATLVVEVHSPSNLRNRANAVFFIGSNIFGQTSPSYIRTASCGAPEIIDLADPSFFGGFPDMHIVLNVLGDLTAACDNPCSTCAACACDWDGDPACGFFDFLFFQNAFVLADPCACGFDGDPACGFFDFLFFQNEFVLGCP